MNTRIVIQMDVNVWVEDDVCLEMEGLQPVSREAGRCSSLQFPP